MVNELVNVSILFLLFAGGRGDAEGKHLSIYCLVASKHPSHPSREGIGCALLPLP